MDGCLLNFVCWPQLVHVHGACQMVEAHRKGEVGSQPTNWLVFGDEQMGRGYLFCDKRTRQATTGTNLAGPSCVFRSEVPLDGNAILPLRAHAVIVSPQSHSVPVLISVACLCWESVDSAYRGPVCWEGSPAFILLAGQLSALTFHVTSRPEPRP